VSTNQLEVRAFLIELKVFFKEQSVVWFYLDHFLPEIAANAVVVVNMKVFEAAEVECR
jgi:hypothetical protein